jgi:RimJ/RimL family protein N-acetyltransferase
VRCIDVMKEKIEGIVIREAIPSDAEQLVAYVNALADEPDVYIALSPGEFKLTPDEEREFLEQYASSENSIFMVAEFKGEIIGILNCRGGSRKSTQHTAVLGMSVSRAWRNEGVGSLLLEHVIQWARENPILSRIELNVFVDNAAAIHLYSKVGFHIEGQRRKSIFRGGKYHDDYLMALLL